MKYLIILAALFLTACDSPSQPKSPDTPVAPDKDCTNGDGKPC